MKPKEIALTPSRDEFNEEFVHYFANAPVVATIHNMVLRKAVDEFKSIHYGIFNPAGELVSYLELVKKPEYYQVSLPLTMIEYRRQGWATYLYDYAVLNDKLTIASDRSQTPEAKLLWKSIARNNRYEVYMLNTETGEKKPFNYRSNVPWNKKNERTMILITEEFSPEDLALFESWSCPRGIRAERRKAGRDHLYGPGTSSKLFVNP